MKMSYVKNKFKISAPSSNEEFELPDLSYSVSDIQDYFEYTIKKRETSTDNPPIKIYVNKIEKRITNKIKTGYCLKHFTPETMKLLKTIRSKITKNENGENELYFEIPEVVAVVHCNIANNEYQQDFRLVYRFVPNKSLGQFLDISPTRFILLKTFNSSFS